MTQQIINIGAVANDQSGDTIRVAFGKVNSNFTDVYTQINALGALTLPTNTAGFLYNNGAGVLSWHSATINSIDGGGA